MVLREGVDVNKLGRDIDSPLLNRSYSSPYTPIPSPLGPRPRANTPMKSSQPGTPVVVPPTPSSVATTVTSASTNSSSARTASPIQPQRDALLESNDDSSERQTNRRSIYRSPGTSSSPDLATLVRKAKERGGVINAQQYKNLKERENKKDEPTPPLPSLDRPSSGGSSSITGRQRSSTSASPGFRSPSPRTGKSNEGSNPRMKETGTLRVSFLGFFYCYI